MLLEIPFFKEAWKKKRKAGSFFLFKKYRVPIFEHKLKIQQTDSYQIIDGNQKGPGYDDFLNEIRFDLEKNVLWIDTVIAKGIKINIRKLELWIEDTERLFQEVSRYSIF
jgi:hypothetical protein